MTSFLQLVKPCRCRLSIIGGASDPRSSSLETVLSTLDDSPFDLQATVQQSLAGDQHAMLSLVRQFQGRVFGLCLRMLGQREDAEDATQETFVRALRHLSRWDA